MVESQKTVLVDDEVASQVLAIIRDAQKYVFIVTPYLDLWGHARDALSLAVKKGVKVTAILRLEPGVLEKDDVAWLDNNGVKVLAVEKLHAKIYLNEHALVVSSMNLMKSSAQNSHEIALIIRDEQATQRIRGYVKDTLMGLSKPISASSAQSTQQPIGLSAQSYLRKVAGIFKRTTGVCIRCRRPIALNRDKPLCEKCYDEWAQYGNPDYPEQVCHSCGWETHVSYARPLCGACFRRLG